MTVWASGSGTGRSGLTISSLLVADGDPGQVLGLVDEDSDFWADEPETWVVNVLGVGHRFLADAFAGTAPAPGGPFKLGSWTDSEWGPVLAETSGWIGVRRSGPVPRNVGWGLLVEGTIEHIEVGDAAAMIHLRGRYRETGIAD